MTVEKAFEEAETRSEFVRGYFSYLASLFDRIDCDAVARAIEALEDAGRAGRTVYVIGNGGSAATASHFANDLGIGTRVDGHFLYRVHSLVDNNAVVTALANDIGYSSIFHEQLEPILEADDVVLAMSVSGNSPNVVEAVQLAKDRDAVTIGCTGFDGGALRRICDINVHVPTPRGEYGPVEDVFMIFDHIVHAWIRISRAGTLRRAPVE